MDVTHRDLYNVTVAEGDTRLTHYKLTLAQMLAIVVGFADTPKSMQRTITIVRVW